MKKATKPLSADLRAGGFEVFPLAKLFALPSNVWFASTLIRENMLAEPLAAWAANALYGLGCLGVRDRFGNDDCFWYSPDYDTHGDMLAPNHFVQRLTPAKAHEIIARVIRNAENFNADPSRDFIIESLGIFGSVLRQADSPGDVDIVFSACWRDDNTSIPEASYLPFGGLEPVNYVSRALGRGSRRMDLSCHYILEVQSIGAPYRIIWTRKDGRVDRPIIVPKKLRSNEDETQLKLSRANEFADSFRRRCASLPLLSPPRMPSVDPVAPPMSHSKWIRTLETKHPVVDLAHALCLPSGELKDKVNSMLEECFHKQPCLKTKAHKMLDSYLAASALYGEWNWAPEVGLGKAKRRLRRRSSAGNLGHIADGGFV